MQNRVKNPTPPPDRGGVARRKLVRLARQHESCGATAAEFARKDNLPGTEEKRLVKSRAGSRGRPRKLHCFNETQILKLLFGENGFQDWESVKELIRRQSGEDLSRKSVFRLLGRWGINHRTGSQRGRILLLGGPWQQPMDTVDGRAAPLEGMLWRIVSGRGVEAFMLTSENSAAAAGKVAAAAVGCFKNRKRELRTNNPYLAESLRGKLKGWRVDLAMD